MTPVNVVLIRRVNDRAAVARYHDVFHFKFAWSEKRSRATGGGNGIQMVPAVLLGSEDDSVSREMEGFVFREIRKRAGEFFGAMPDGARLAGCRIGNINGPRIRSSLQQCQTLLKTMDANERNLLAVRRPTWHGVTIHRRSQVADGLAAEIVDSDEAVIASMRDKGDLRAIGGPLRRIVFAAHERELTCGHCAGYWGSPELPARGPNSHSAIG